MGRKRTGPLASRLWSSAILLAWLTSGALFSAQSPQPRATFPGKDWERVASPESAGFDAARLEALRAWLKTFNTTSMVVSEGGRIVFEYGDTSRVSKVASVRKSVLAMLFGKYVAEGKVDLDKTVKQLGLDDKLPFLPVEEGATLRQVLAARSGVYLPSGNEELTSVSPRRGSYSPGSYFQYQNWDFNAAGTAFEKLTGKDIFDALESDLARPIGMQDFDRARQRKISSPDSVHPEYAMYLSTRDMARLGLLMLRGGTWNEKRLIPQDWCRTITTLITPLADIHPAPFGAATWSRRWGYGLLWWVWDAPNAVGAITGPYEGAYSAMGAYGQYITVLPVYDLVVAHKVDFDEDERLGRPVRQVGIHEYDTILQMVMAASK
jgi:CubicO group peptidase (beta-lactamase class C family)